MLELGQVIRPEGSPRKTTARLLFDERNLYIAVQCEEPETAILKTDAQASDGAADEDDCVRIFISTDADRGYRHIRVNPAGTVADEACPLDGSRIAAWDSKSLVKTSVEKDKGWTVTLAVPLQTLDAYVGKDLTWGVNIVRYRPARGGEPAMQSSWAVLPVWDFGQPHAFGRVRGIDIPSRPDGVTQTREKPAIWPDTVGYVREEIDVVDVGPDEAAVNVRISNHRWPDCYSNETAIRDIFRIEGAADKSDQDKAFALWKWWRILVSGSCGGYCYETNAGGESDIVFHSHKIFTVYGHHMCDGQSWGYVPLWRAAGYFALDECHTGHTIVSLRYKDHDGQYRFHDFDPQLRFYWWDDKHDWASTWTMPVLTARVHRHLREPVVAHTLRTSLRTGETLERTWDNEGHVIQAGVPEKQIVLKGPYVHKPGRKDGVYTAVGQETQVLAADTTPAGFARVLGPGSVNVACSPAAAGKAALHPAAAKQVARFVYRMPSPYVAVNAAVNATLVRDSENDLAQLSISTDGGMSFQPIYTMQETGSKKVHVDIGTAARAQDKPSVYTAYEFLVMAEFASDNDPSRVGMDDLTVTADRQLSKRALPNLMPGENVLRVTADRFPAEQMLEVEVSWRVDGEAHKVVKRIGRVPFYFDINTGEIEQEYPKSFHLRFNDLRLQMDAIRMRLVPADGAKADESLAAAVGEAKFRQACPHPASFPDRKIQKHPEADVMQTSGFFPQGRLALHDGGDMDSLIEQMRTGADEMARWRAIDDLADYPGSVNTMLEMVPTADLDILMHICKVLAQHPHKKMIPALLARWERAPAGSPGTRYIPDVLAAIGDRSVVPELIRPLKGLRFDHRFHVAYALGILGGEQAEAALADMAANDPAPYVRQLAAEALSSLSSRAKAHSPGLRP